MLMFLWRSLHILFVDVNAVPSAVIKKAEVKVLPLAAHLSLPFKRALDQCDGPMGDANSTKPKT